jgi:acyl carrier protein
METINSDNIYDRVTKVIKEVLSIEGLEITKETNYRDDLGADSIDNVTLLCALEEEFGGKIDDNEAASLITIEDTVKFIKEKILQNEQ